VRLCDIWYWILWECEIYRIEYCESVRYIALSTVKVWNLSYWVLWECAIYRIEYRESVRFIVLSTVRMCDISYWMLWECAIYRIEYCDSSQRDLYLTSLVAFGKRSINLFLNTLWCWFAPTKSRISCLLSRCTKFPSVRAQTANAAALSAAKQRPTSCSKSSIFPKHSNLIQTAVFGTKYGCGAFTPLMIICYYLLHSVIYRLQSFDDSHYPSRTQNSTCCKL